MKNAKQEAGQTSGMEKIPLIYSRPLHKGRFFWITIATAFFWAALIWYVFFA